MQRLESSARAQVTPAAHPPLRTLVVGSDPRFCLLVAGYLGSLPQFDVIDLARSGWEALQLFAEHDPALVIADFTLTDMTGAAIARALKARATAPIVLVMSTQPSKDIMEISLKAGADDYLSRTDLGHLPEVLRRIETRQRRH